MRKKDQKKVLSNRKPAGKIQKNESAGCSLKKQYLKSGSSCRVTFRLPKEAALDARFVSVVGEFNDWDSSEMPMKKLKNGDYKTILTLTCNREYRFRYLINGIRWENDWNADRYMPNTFGCDDSIVVV